MKTLSTRLLVAICLISTCMGSAFAGFFDFSSDENSRIPYCEQAGDCTLNKGTEIVKNNIQDIQTQKTFSAYAQDIVAYLLGFLSLLAVVYLIYGGFLILTAGADTKKVDESKTIIKNALLGLLLIFLAYSIVAWFMGVLNANGSTGRVGLRFPTFIEQAHALSPGEKKTFAEYKEQILVLTSQLEREYKVNGKMSGTSLSQLEALCTRAFSTLPDEENVVYNTNLYKAVLTSIDVLKKKSSETSLISLAKDLNAFLETIKIQKIKGNLVATPNNGNAPLAVTLRTENMVDPTGVIIPKGNYVWYMKTAGGGQQILGTGPSISYTFNDERNYTVYLSVSSASKNKNGYTDVLPFNSSVVVTVEGRIANIRMFINGTDVSYTDTYKAHPNDARGGLVFDATSSFPADGSRFVYTTWDFGNGNTASYNGAPKVEQQTYANEGTYTVKLKVSNNEGKEMTKNMTIVVRDPIATIIRDKDEGSVGEEFRFSPSSYFQRSDKVSYGWQILDLESGKGIYESAMQNITYKFLKVGKYAVRLTVSAPDGQKDIESIKITIESKSPISTFDTQPVSGEQPNVYKFDGSRSYDPDTLENSKLEFRWLMDGQEIQLANPSQNGSMGTYTFSTLWSHKIALEVTNQDGKKGTFLQNVTVNSLLSVKMRTPTKISFVGRSVQFLVEAPQATTFEWSFGDGESDVTSATRESHTYKKSGTYDVTLTVRGKNGVDVNSITRKVFIKGADEPMAYLSVKKDMDEIIPTPGACGGKEAYVVDRVTAVTMSAEDSVNADGTSNGLSYSWKFFAKNSSQRNFSYKFDELGCFPVSLTIRSQKTGKTSSETIYVKVENVVPKVSGLSIVPQSLDKDPVVVNVTANNAKDDDGVVVSYMWYYYTEGNPEPQDVRITKSPKTTFVLPKVSDKYFFVLVMEDSNGAKVNTDELFQEKYSLQILSDNTNTPLISLKMDKRNAGVGDTVKFSAEVKNVLGLDITKKVEYKWDFDGDGFYDKTTTEPEATYIFKKAGEFHVKVKANYKGVSNTRSEKIIIENMLSPDFATIGVGSKMAFVNTSKGVYKAATWKIGSKIISDKLDSFVYEFAEGDLPKDVTLEISDGSDTKIVTLPVKKDGVNKKMIEKKTDPLIYFTYPRSRNDAIVLEDPTQKFFIYMGESTGEVASYSIDTDISVDTDLNGGADDDQDNKGTDSYSKGAPFLVPLDTIKARNVTMRLSLLDKLGKVIAYKDIAVTLDYNTQQQTIVANTATGTVNAPISDTDKANFSKIKALIAKLPQKDQSTFVPYYNAIQENWTDSREKTRAIIDFESFVQTNALLDDKTKEAFYDALESLLIADTQKKDAISLAVKVIESLVGKAHPKYAQIEKDLNDILSHPTDYEANKKSATDILSLIKDDTVLTASDKSIIKSQLQLMLGNKTATAAASADSGMSAMGIIGGIFRIFGLLLLAAIGAFGALFVFYKISVDKSKHESFQDYFIETFLGGNKDENGEDYVVAPKTKDDILASLAEAEKPKEEAVVAPTEIEKPAEVAADTALRNSLPDWMKPVDGLSKIEELEQKEEEAVNADFEKVSDTEEVAPPAEADIPDWLRGSSLSQTTEETPVVEDANIPAWLSPELQQEALEETAVELAESEEVVVPKSTEDELPDWLKGSNTTAEEENVVAEEETPQEEVANNSADILPDWLKGSAEPVEQVTEEIPTKETLVEIKTEEVASASEDELPDWLKNANTPAQAIEEVVAEEETSAIAPVVVEKEDTEELFTLPSWMTELPEETNPLMQEGVKVITTSTEETVSETVESSVVEKVEETTPEEVVEMEEIVTTTEEEEVASVVAPAPSAVSSEVPDWLKNQEIPTQPTPQPAAPQLPDWLKEAFAIDDEPVMPPVAPAVNIPEEKPLQKKDQQEEIIASSKMGFVPKKQKESTKEEVVADEGAVVSEEQTKEETPNEQPAPKKPRRRNNGKTAPFTPKNNGTPNLGNEEDLPDWLKS